MPEQNDIEKFPANSLAKKENQRAKEVQPVVKKGSAKVRKQSFGEKFADAMLAMDLKEAFLGTIKDILVPAAQDMFVDAVDGAANRLVYGDSDRRRRSRRGDTIEYNSIYAKRRRENDISRPKPRNFICDLGFDTRQDALEVLANLKDLLDEYQVVSVMDLYSSSGLKTDPTQDKWGWYDLDEAEVIRTREGWVLNLPKPQRLD